MDDARRRPRALAALTASLTLVFLTACTTLSGISPSPRTSPGINEVARQGALSSHTASLNELDRTWLTYVPARLDGPAAVIVLFHGSGDTAQGIRAWVGSYFERIADENGVIIAYPDGYEHNWNECRREGRWAAKERELDDVGFARTIIDRLEGDLGRGAIDRERVFAAGYSSGGHMAMRLGREADDLVSAITIVAANPPAPHNQSCDDQNSPMPALFIQGMQDSVNPFEGGEVRVFGPGGSRGEVMSAEAGAQWYADVNHAGPPTPIAGPDRVHITEWAGEHPVRLVAVENETHNFPLSSFHGPNAMWEFLAQINAPIGSR
ncbi:alpha/beta hydrolase family esterase [Granulicoccus sp. GXG6511]|uniref:alpha/beta hydrolase family esterase n=1 Tax=Granulicoccus sp. GXG6511 TaxID=3381351 RepID=UPI003D7D6BE1